MWHDCHLLLESLIIEEVAPSMAYVALQAIPGHSVVATLTCVLAAVAHSCLIPSQAAARAGTGVTLLSATVFAGYGCSKRRAASD